MSAGGLAVAIVFLAVFNEWVTERLFGQWVKGGFMILLATVIGVTLACTVKIGGLSMVGIDTNLWVDRVITGLIIGGGSNAVHQFFGKYIPSKPSE